MGRFCNVAAFEIGHSVEITIHVIRIEITANGACAKRLNIDKSALNRCMTNLRLASIARKPPKISSSQNSEPFIIADMYVNKLCGL